MTDNNHGRNIGCDIRIGPNKDDLSVGTSIHTITDVTSGRYKVSDDGLATTSWGLFAAPGAPFPVFHPSCYFVM